MPTNCFVANCKSLGSKENRMQFFRVPQCMHKRRLWIEAIGRIDREPRPMDRICSRHFHTGRPSDDVNHQDYVPSRYLMETSLPKKRRKVKTLRLVGKNNVYDKIYVCAIFSRFYSILIKCLLFMHKVFFCILIC